MFTRFAFLLVLFVCFAETNASRYPSNRLQLESAETEISSESPDIEWEDAEIQAETQVGNEDESQLYRIRGRIRTLGTSTSRATLEGACNHSCSNLQDCAFWQVIGSSAISTYATCVHWVRYNRTAPNMQNVRNMHRGTYCNRNDSVFLTMTYSLTTQAACSESCVNTTNCLYASTRTHNGRFECHRFTTCSQASGSEWTTMHVTRSDNILGVHPGIKCYRPRPSNGIFLTMTYSFSTQAQCNASCLSMANCRYAATRTRNGRFECHRFSSCDQRSETGWTTIHLNRS